MALHSKSNLNEFLSCENTGELLTTLYTKQQRCYHDFIYNHHMQLFQEYVNNNLENIFNHLTDSNLLAEDVYQEDNNDIHLRIIFKWIDLLMSDHNFSNQSLNDALEALYDITSADFSFMSYLFAIYMLNRYDILKIEEAQRQFFIYLLEPYIELCESKFLEIYNKQEITKINESITGFENEISKKGKIIKKLKKKTEHNRKKQEAFIQEIKKKSETKIETLKDSHRKKTSSLEKEINELTESLINSQNDFVISDPVEQSATNNELQQKIEKQDQVINQLNGEIKSIRDKSIYEHLRSYLDINGPDEKILQLIYLYTNNYNFKVPSSMRYINDSSAKDTIGVCVIKDGEHLIKTLSNEYFPINNIPLDSFVANNSFVRVDINQNFICSYGSLYEEKTVDSDIKEFVLVNYQREEFFAIDADNRRIKLNNINNFSLRENNVVAINDNHDVIALYKKIPFILDYYDKSIKALKLSAYCVLNTVESGLLVRDIMTGHESYIRINSLGIEQMNIIFVYQDRICKKIETPKFYTKSKYYNNDKVGIVKIMNDKFFVNKPNGETCLLKGLDSSDNFEDGQLIRVDEFNFYIKVEKDSLSNGQSTEKQLLYVRKKEKQYNEVMRIRKQELDQGSVLIIGDIKLRSSYEKAFNSAGYIVQVISGFETHHKLLKEAKAYEKVIFVDEHASHENYYLLKRNFHSKIIYTQNGGANRVLDVLLEKVSS